jgi:hypothetical protein
MTELNVGRTSALCLEGDLVSYFGIPAIFSTAMGLPNPQQ